MKQKQLLAALLCAVTPFAYAETTDKLDEVVVTATRVPQPLKQSLAHTTVITLNDIQASQAVDVPTLLKTLAGVELYQSGGVGKQSSLFMRGTNSSHTLVLLDGVRINSATTGATAIDQLMLDQIERIEVVRGNVSSVYGSEAIGGVIQIFTKQGKSAPALNASVGAANHNTRRLSAGYGGVADGRSFNMQVSKYRTDGVSAMNTSLVPFANPDNDAYSNTSYSASGRFSLSESYVLNASIFASDADVNYDSAWASPSDVHTSRSQLNKVAASIESSFSESWQSKLQWAKGGDSLKNYLNGVPDAMAGTLIKTANDQLTWENIVAAGGRDYWQFGAERVTQQVESDTAYTLTMRKADSLFAGYVAHTATQQLQLNVRQDRYEDFGKANTALLAYGIDFSEAWRASASASTGFKAPTFNDLYSPWGGNPNLKPERSRNNEVGLHYASPQSQRLDASYFDNRIQDLIASDSSWTMQNLNAARINGWELAYSGDFSGTVLSASLTRQNPRDEATGLQLLRRAKNFANVGLGQKTGDFHWGAEWQYSGAREDLDIATSARTTLPAYRVVNLTALYKLGKQLDMTMRVDNLLKTNYALAHGYNTLGRSVFIGLSYQ